MADGADKQKLATIGLRHSESIQVTLTEPGVVTVTMRSARAVVNVAAPEGASIDRRKQPQSGEEW